MANNDPGEWQQHGSVAPPTEEERAVHPLGPETPLRFEEPNFGTTGAVGYDESVEDDSMINMRVDSPVLPELQAPVQAFHSTPINEEGHQDPRNREKFQRTMPLSANQSQTEVTTEASPTDQFLSEKFIVPTSEQPSEHWTIEQYTFPTVDGTPLRIAERQERRKYVLLVGSGATLSIGPAPAQLVPYLGSVGNTQLLKLSTLGPIYANSTAAATVTVIQEFQE